MIIPDKILEFLLPEIKNLPYEEIRSSFVKIHLEVENILFRTIQTEMSEFIYWLKPVCGLFDYPSLWVVSRELSLLLDISHSKRVSEKEMKEFLSNRELISFLLKTCEKKVSENHSENVWTFLKLIFGDPEKNESIFKLGIRSFFKNRNIEWLECDSSKKEIIESIKMSEEEISQNRAASIVSLPSLLPIFSDLRKNWENLVIQKLIPHYFSFKSLDFSEKNFEVQWPIWYRQDNLPSFNEILFRLTDFQLVSKEIGNSNYKKLSDGKSSSDKPLTLISGIRKCLLSKGFVECNTTKFSPCQELNNEVDLVLEYNPTSTLRDDIVNSVVKQVLLKNLNLGNNLYPIFELAYCPWKSSWQLALLSTVLLEGGDEKYITQKNIFFYDLEELYEILKELFKGKLNVKPLKELKKIENSSGATEFAHIVNSKDEQIGTVRVHRLESFEIRHMEIISICIDLKIFRDL
ncbi:hypothetical protein [Mycoplasma suis]|uniref:Putative phenylalanyl-tRNA synthetase, beta subunit n=1 Tax=Mycoplasma suis (strain Illinois) TaxID=768700 RepID=F0QQ58_MYCSL|nr:hypothetical protein [Mycoplasma suis]ADX97628.1 putative phenylalanyl-tRNA synthetase, beta subunit [Mycoplasma suis str. Illinois]